MFNCYTFLPDLSVCGCPLHCSLGEFGAVEQVNQTVTTLHPRLNKDQIPPPPLLCAAPGPRGITSSVQTPVYSKTNPSIHGYLLVVH